MSKMSVNCKTILTSLFLAVVALPLFGGATGVSAVSQNSGTTINVVVEYDGIDLSLESVNGKQSSTGEYTTTKDTATVIFEAVGVGEIYITDSDGNVLFSVTKTTPELEEITAVFPIGDVPGTYDYILIMDNGSGDSKEVPFHIILEAANIPEIPVIPDLPGLPDTGYTKIFGYVVTNKGLSSIVFMTITFVAIVMICLLFILFKKRRTIVQAPSVSKSKMANSTSRIRQTKTKK